MLIRSTSRPKYSASFECKREVSGCELFRSTRKMRSCDVVWDCFVFSNERAMLIAFWVSVGVVETTSNFVWSSDESSDTG